MAASQLAQAATDAAPEPTRFPIWMYSPGWDFVTLLSGLSLCLIFAACHPFGLDARLLVAFVACERFVALTHSWSTTYMVTASKMFAPLRKLHRDRFLTMPILIFLFSICLGILVTKTVQIPDDGSVDRLSWLYYLYMGLYMIGHFWHFGRQDFGVLSLYRQRAGQFSSRDRQVDQVYAQIMMYVIQPIVYTRAFVHFPFSQMMFWIPGWQNSLDVLGASAMVAAVALFISVLFVELRKKNRSTPKLLYYSVMFFHPTFLFFAGRLMPYWYISYLWGHWIIASNLAYHVNKNYQVDNGASPRRATLKHLAVIGAVTVAVWLMTRPLADFSFLSKDFVDAREILRTLPPAQYTIVGIFLGLILGEQLVHYYCDRCLFRFKDPEVRAAVTPYL